MRFGDFLAYEKNIQERGGLHNRVTRQIPLKPFTLAECKEFFDSRGVVFNTQDVVESYMIFGSVPYYLRMIEKRTSLAINVDRMCFEESAPLKHEFNRLMDALFSNPEKHIQVLEVLQEKKQGLTRETIAKQINFGNGGNLTRILGELTECGFIRKYKPFGQGKNGALYHLTDPFVAFHLTFIRKADSENYWSTYIDNAGHRAWSGYAFEKVCLAHTGEIKKTLGISGVHANISSWISRSSENGAQIDLVIDRADRVINLFEIKFAKSLFEIDRSVEKNLRNKIEIFRAETKTRKALHLVMITTYGVKPGKHSGVVQAEVVMEDLF